MKDDSLYLIHISECIARIENYVTDKNQEDFLDSYLIQDAVLRNLQILAESTQRLSSEIKIAHPAVPWRKIAGLDDEMDSPPLHEEKEEPFVGKLGRPNHEIRIQKKRMSLRIFQFPQELQPQTHYHEKPLQNHIQKHLSDFLFRPASD